MYKLKTLQETIYEDWFKWSSTDVPHVEHGVNENMLTNQEIFEDSAGIIELKKDLSVRDSNNKIIHLKKGARGQHKRTGWDSDWFVYKGKDIPMMYKGYEQFKESDVEIIN